MQSEMDVRGNTGIVGALQQLDQLLRGEATRLSALKRGVIDLPENGLTGVIWALGLFYGLCMGCFALFSKSFDVAVLQLISTMAKVPVLFFATLLVTFPSLYVFNALVGSRLTVVSVWRLLIASMAVMLAVLASLGPVVAFFAVSTTNYPFMLLLNVVVFALAGLLGLKFLLHTLHRLSVVLREGDVPAPVAQVASAAPAIMAPPTPNPSTASIPARPQYSVLTDAQWATMVQEAREAVRDGRATPWTKQRLTPTPSPAPVIHPTPSVNPNLPDPFGALERVDNRMLGSKVMTVFYIWILAFGLVGAQMSWMLRPFISAPTTTTFHLFSAHESNFYAAVWSAFSKVFGG